MKWSVLVMKVVYSSVLMVLGVSITVHILKMLVSCAQVSILIINKGLKLLLTVCLLRVKVIINSVFAKG